MSDEGLNDRLSRKAKEASKSRCLGASRILLLPFQASCLLAYVSVAEDAPVATSQTTNQIHNHVSNITSNVQFNAAVASGITPNHQSNAIHERYWRFQTKEHQHLIIHRRKCNKNVGIKNCPIRANQAGPLYTVEMINECKYTLTM